MNFTENIRTFRVLKVEQVDTTEVYEPGHPFSIFITPSNGSAAQVGDVALISCRLPYSSQNTTVPVLTGDWSPVIFDALAANAVTNDFDVYAAELRFE